MVLCQMSNLGNVTQAASVSACMPSAGQNGLYTLRKEWPGEYQHYLIFCSSFQTPL